MGHPRDSPTTATLNVGLYLEGDFAASNAIVAYLEKHFSHFLNNCIINHLFNRIPGGFDSWNQPLQPSRLNNNKSNVDG